MYVRVVSAYIVCISVWHVCICPSVRYYLAGNVPSAVNILECLKKINTNDHVLGPISSLSLVLYSFYLQNSNSS